MDEYRALLATVDDTDHAPPDFLLRAACLIARHRHPDTLDEAAINSELDRLAVAVKDTLGAGPHYPLHMCRVLSRVLYEVRSLLSGRGFFKKNTALRIQNTINTQDFGFSGATQSYYDPDNSCINMVLERRVGIPISLSLVYMEVARRVGLEMLGSTCQVGNGETISYFLTTQCNRALYAQAQGGGRGDPGRCVQWGEVRHYTTGITTQHTTNHNTPPTTQHTTNRFAFWKTQRQSCRCCMVAQ